MSATYQRLYINIDHVATLRQARMGIEPDPVEAAVVCEEAGADGITAHLRIDRRHIHDQDLINLRAKVTTYFNLELACTEEMINIALNCNPEQITLVPERREEITTEGGLDVGSNSGELEKGLARFKDAGIRTSLFIDADPEAVRWSKKIGADSIELHTGPYAHHPHDPSRLQALQDAARLAADLGLFVHAGHGLTVNNVGAVAAIPEVEELNIGHSVVSRSVFIGLPAAVREIRDAMVKGRAVLG